MGVIVKKGPVRTLEGNSGINNVQSREKTNVDEKERRELQSHLKRANCVGKGIMQRKKEL